MDEGRVFIALTQEREYQHEKWGDTDQRNTVGDFILYMQRELEKARDAYISPADPLDPALTAIRKVTALGVAAMEKFGIGEPRPKYKSGWQEFFNQK